MWCISLDGRKSINDNMRKTHEGERHLRCDPAGLPQNWRNPETSRITTYAAHILTITRILPATSLHMADLGFKELSIEPVVAPPEAPYALQESDIPKLLSEVRTTGNAKCCDTKTGRQGTRLHLLSLHDRPDRRTVHRQADLRLRRGHGIRCGDPDRRPVPVPSVRR